MDVIRYNDDICFDFVTSLLKNDNINVRIDTNV